MAKSQNLFDTQLGGYNKKQVDEYISKQGVKNQVVTEKLKAENAELKARLESVEAMYDKILAKFEDLQNDKDTLAKILIDAERRAGEIVDDAHKEVEKEKDRLNTEADKIKDKIQGRSDLLRKMDVASREFAYALIEQVKASAGVFETELLNSIDEASAETEKYLAETDELVKRTDKAGAESDAKDESEDAADELNVAEDMAFDKPEEDDGDGDDDESGDGLPDDYTFSESEDAGNYFEEQSESA